MEVATNKIWWRVVENIQGIFRYFRISWNRGEVLLVISTLNHLVSKSRQQLRYQLSSFVVPFLPLCFPALTYNTNCLDGFCREENHQQTYVWQYVFFKNICCQITTVNSVFINSAVICFVCKKCRRLQAVLWVYEVACSMSVPLIW